MNVNSNWIPSEAQEQKWLFQWAALRKNAHPELELLLHVPNGGTRDPREARNLKAEGVKSGVPDIMLPVARNGYHGLFIEMKRVRGGKVSDTQKVWIKALNDQGYKAVVAHGFEEARVEIEEYLKMEGNS